MERGRRAQRNPEATRASILEAAEGLFVEKGFAATSMSDIASAAGVTKSLIHHHFGSKEELWTEVKRERVSHWAEVQRELIDSPDGEGASILRRSIETLFRFLQENPEFVRLRSWMNLEDPRLAEAAYPEILTLGLERIRDQQKRGRIRDDIEPRHVVVLFVSMCTQWFMTRANWVTSLDEEARRVEDQRYLDALLKVFFEGVRPR
ncbi:MAG TPA: TetR family transcriptional regulator [Thermoanaerobaculia bacterium]|nr:TetR family transcriptional regulator [Thermoanaerobaculia bacterium]